MEIQKNIERNWDAVSKPVPRIEEESGNGHLLYFDNEHILPQETYIGPNAKAALESLFGKPMPIYEPKQGMWKRLLSPEGLSPMQAGMTIDICNELPFKVWRYTR